MIVIYDTLGAYGGSHTLMLRMGQWLHDNGIKMTIIATRVSNEEIVGKLRAEDVRIIEADLHDLKKGKKIIENLLKEDDIKMFCFTWEHYLDVECLKRKYSISFNNFVYCIHPETFKKGRGFKTAFMRAYSIITYRRIFARMVNNDSLISLDKVNIQESKKYLRCKNQKRIPIVYLPMYCPERDDKDEIIKKGFSNNVILTAARADFPYKGYMIGLVEMFARMKKEYPKMILEIVSSGDDIQQLKETIEQQGNEVKEAIKLHGWMEYDELKEKMRECRVYIGMGTSVFDASLQYKPSIVVKFNTMKCISDHFVSERPTYMTVPVKCKQTARNRIERAFNWEFDEYREQSLSSFEKTKNIYDINNCMKKLISMDNKSKESIIGTFESLRHYLNRGLNKIRFKNVIFADYRNLEWETNKRNG